MAQRRHSDYVSEVRAEARALWEAYHNLLELQDEWNARDFTTEFSDPGSPAFDGTNDDLDTIEVSAVVFDTTNAIKGLMDAGHATNVTRLL